MALVFYFPGKMGDALLQWPVAYQVARQRQGVQFEAWLDEGTCQPLVPLFEAQPCVSAVKLIPASEHYRCGGQPWQGKFTPEDHNQNEIHSLGMRSFPQRQITLQTLEWLPFEIDRQALALEPSLQVIAGETKNRLVLHGTFQSNAGAPAFWRLLNRIQGDLEGFEEIVFVGTPEERARAIELYPQWTEFDDHGSFLELAKLIAESRFVIGAGSSVVTLAGNLKVPSLRVHDPIGEAPRVLWSNLGPQQYNETERDLRRIWPEILASVTPKVVVA